MFTWYGSVPRMSGKRGRKKNAYLVAGKKEKNKKPRKYMGNGNEKNDEAKESKA